MLAYLMKVCVARVDSGRLCVSSSVYSSTTITQLSRVDEKENFTHTHTLAYTHDAVIHQDTHGVFYDSNSRKADKIVKSYVYL